MNSRTFKVGASCMAKKVSVLVFKRLAPVQARANLGKERILVRPAHSAQMARNDAR
jgi:hypothetical protein